MKILYRYFAIFFPSLLMLISCGRNNSTDEVNNNDGDNPQTETCKGNPFFDIDIYANISSSYCSTTELFGENTGIWKNFNNKIFNPKSALDMIINSTDVYTVELENGNFSKKVIKKNGNTLYMITKDDVGITSDEYFKMSNVFLYVDGNDVYYATYCCEPVSPLYDNYNYALFKNGRKIGQTPYPGPNNSRQVLGIGKINGNIALYGTFTSSSEKIQMCYWINGNILVKYDGFIKSYIDIDQVGKSLFHQNSLYNIRNCYTTWNSSSSNTKNGYVYKDGQEIFRTTDNVSRFNYLYISDSDDIFISGRTEIGGKEFPCYWKNGEINIFKNFTESIPPFFSKINVINNKVVIATIYRNKPFIYVDGVLYPICIKENLCHYSFYGLQVIPK